MPVCEQLVEATLVRRYKRFLADVELGDGTVAVVHCPNPGSMIGVCAAGSRVMLRPAANASRKLPFSWVLTGVGSQLVNVDTLLANKVVFDALANGQLPPFLQYDLVHKEKTFGDSRFDFLLEDSKGSHPSCFVEVKSTTLVEGDVAMFPDAVTARGRKHLSGLTEAVSRGHRAVQFFSIARCDVAEFRPAQHIDPAYTVALCSAHVAGVEMMAWTTEIVFVGGRATFTLGKSVPVILPS